MQQYTRSLTFPRRHLCMCSDNFSTSTFPETSSPLKLAFCLLPPKKEMSSSNHPFSGAFAVSFSKGKSSITSIPSSPLYFFMISIRPPSSSKLLAIRPAEKRMGLQQKHQKGFLFGKGTTSPKINSFACAMLILGWVLVFFLGVQIPSKGIP